MTGHLQLQPIQVRRVGKPREWSIGYRNDVPHLDRGLVNPVAELGKKTKCFRMSEIKDAQDSHDNLHLQLERSSEPCFTFSSIPTHSAFAQQHPWFWRWNVII